MPNPITLDGSSLTLADVIAVARYGATVRLSPSAKKQMAASRTWVERAVDDHAVVYGVTTGFGAFQSVSVEPQKLRELQRNLILSHCAGTGDPMPEEVVRAMMILRANALAKGNSGIRVSTVQLLLDMLNTGVHPVVPVQGSVGASGDLAPLSHMAAVMIGEGTAYVKGKVVSGARALQSAGLQPVVLEAKEGIALNNGTQAMTGFGVLALDDAEHLALVADIAGAMSLESVKGKSAPFDARVHNARPHKGQSQSAANIRTMIRGSALVDCLDSDTLTKVQDSYSIRCIPQVHGASRDAMTIVRSVLETEINSATDNPLIFPDDDVAISAGNFHGQPVALVMDYLGLAAAELGNISERRTAKLMDHHHSYGLPPFLADNGGLQSGLMIAQYTAAALVSENKTLMHPASGDSIPTSANQEDHVSMGTIAARHARAIIANVTRILAIELLCASQALEYRLQEPGNGTRSVLAIVRSVVHKLQGDRALSEDIEHIAGLIGSRRLSIGPG
ncbi:MAG: histidine ammonia-lyase [Ignavibacteria bacterium]|nr:histidine ammonia-lyase [Ignavibacteria bacterium]